MRKIYLLFCSALFLASVTFGQIQKPAQPRKVAMQSMPNVELKIPPALFAPGCDTLLYTTANLQTYGGAIYPIDRNSVLDSGFINGLNAFGDKQKGNYFDVTSSGNNSYVTGVRYAFGRANSTNLSHKVYFRVYTVGTTIALAGSSPAIELSVLKPNVGFLVDYVFPTPIPLAEKEFFITVDFSELSTAAGDTLAVYTNNLNLSLNAPDSAVEQWGNNSWSFMSTAWNFGVPYGMFTYLFPYVSSNNSCALPVTLSALSASQVAGSNKLTWSTKTEIGNKGFEIQRSSDGSNFTKLDFVASKAPLGTSSQSIAYEYTDNAPLEAGNYYRIKQIDQNGKLSFTNIALLNRSLDKLKGIITYYPNPVKNSLNLQLAASIQGNNLVTVTNMNGVVVLQESIHTTGSLQNISLNVSRLPKGTYIVKLGGESKSAKFVKE